MIPDILTQAQLKEQLHYDPLTGDFTWLPRDRKYFTSNRIWKSWNTRYSNEKAGADHVHGYINIKLFHVLYRAHRLAFLYMTAEFPNQVDHINRVRNDNRWMNLRAANHQINQQNRSKQSTNTSGFNGVYFDKHANKWRARISVNGKHHHLGRFDNIEDAISARKEANIEHGYHYSHGY